MAVSERRNAISLSTEHPRFQTNVEQMPASTSIHVFYTELRIFILTFPPTKRYQRQM